MSLIHLSCKLLISLPFISQSSLELSIHPNTGNCLHPNHSQIYIIPIANITGMPIYSEKYSPNRIGCLYQCHPLILEIKYSIFSQFVDS